MGPPHQPLSVAKLFCDIIHPYDRGEAVVAEVLLPVIRDLVGRQD